MTYVIMLIMCLKLVRPYFLVLKMIFVSVDIHNKNYVIPEGIVVS